MPTPTFDSKIMPTSLPPSPTEQVLFPVNSSTFTVIIAFYVGEHLHTHTLGAFVAATKNYSSRLGLAKITSNVVPSIISKVFVFFSKSASASYTSLAVVRSLI